MKIVHARVNSYPTRLSLLIAKTSENVLPTDVFRLCDETQEYGFFIVQNIEAGIGDTELTINLVPLNGDYITKKPENYDPRIFINGTYILKRLRPEEGKRIIDGSGIWFG